MSVQRSDTVDHIEVRPEEVVMTIFQLDTWPDDAVEKLDEKVRTYLDTSGRPSFRPRLDDRALALRLVCYDIPPREVVSYCAQHGIVLEAASPSN